MNSDLLVVAAIIVLGFAGYSIFKSKSAGEKESQPEEPLLKLSPLKTDMTKQQLKRFNGETDHRVLVALKGTIYDVSSSEYYRKPSGYAVFAGHDASINLAKMSHDVHHLNQWGVISLSLQETQTLNDWEGRFQSKYPVVGRLLD